MPSLPPFLSPSPPVPSPVPMSPFPCHLRQLYLPFPVPFSLCPSDLSSLSSFIRSLSLAPSLQSQGHFAPD